MNKIIPTGYYTYAYINKKTNLPYYIGKGLGNRMYISHRNHGISTPRNISYIVVLESNLTEFGALALERRMIRWYGRKDNGTGILHNKTDGGDSTIGHIKSKSQIEKHRLKVKGRVSWVNGDRVVRRVDCPGPDWKRGNGQSGKKWWTNGISEVWCLHSPGSEWTNGRIPKMKEHLKSIAYDAGVKASKIRWGS